MSPRLIEYVKRFSGKTPHRGLKCGPEQRLRQPQSLSAMLNCVKAECCRKEMQKNPDLQSSSSTSFCFYLQINSMWRGRRPLRAEDKTDNESKLLGEQTTCLTVSHTHIHKGHDMQTIGRTCPAPVPPQMRQKEAAAAEEKKLLTGCRCLCLSPSREKS